MDVGASLLRSLPYTEYETAMRFSCDTCEELASLAKIKTSYQNLRRPGEQLIRDLDRRGLTTPQYLTLLQTLNSGAPTQLVTERYRPPSKVALLIGNELYQHLGKLRTPEKDCYELGEKLKSLGFIVIILKDVTAIELKRALENIVEVIPDGSYFLVYYAGHGCELCGVRYTLGTDAPCEDVRPEHAASADHILSRAGRCRPELCVLLVDMCAFGLSRESNPALQPEAAGGGCARSVVVGYSASPEEGAYERVEMSFSTSGLVEEMVELNTADHARAVPKASLYAASLCRHICRKLYIGDILDLVSEDLTCKGQTPVKVQSGPRKRYLYDKVSGDQQKVLKDIREVLSSYGSSKNCTILDLA